MIESEWLEKCNKVAKEKGLPQGNCVERIYYAAESGALRIIVAGHRYEVVHNSPTNEVVYKP